MRQEVEVLYDGDQYTVVALRSGDRCAFEEFLDGKQIRSSRDRKKKIAKLLRRFAEGGPPHNPEKFHQVDDEHNLYVLKPDGQVRLPCFYDTSGTRKLLVITHGYVKKSRKMPPREKKRAQEAKRRYFEKERERHDAA